MNQLPLRPNVCLIIINNDNRIFVGERADNPGHWQFPQGGAEPDLSLEENALREAEEELGASSNCFEVIQQLEATHQYDWETPPDYAVGKWRGQSQTFWLIRFTGDDSEIDLNKHVPEFISWKWVDIDQVQSAVAERRWGGYEAPLKEVKTLLG